MPKSRKTQVSLDATRYYHCSSRCARRAFLCGKDAVTGQSFAHRRQWIEDKLMELETVFAIYLCAFSVMHNHYHVVLFIDKLTADNWDALEVVERWHLLLSGTLYSQRFSKGELLTEPEQVNLNASIVLWRERLMDISWCMRIINEAIARMANREDDCTGRFWEGRFSSQALFDEKALAACSTYVDLNPIRAGIADSLIGSDHTSIKRRCEQAAKAEQQTDGLLPSPVTPGAICQTAYHFD
jgi:REP element-mobilizing transposase RayT